MMIDFHLMLVRPEMLRAGHMLPKIPPATDYLPSQTEDEANEGGRDGGNGGERNEGGEGDETRE